MSLSETIDSAYCGLAVAPSQGFHPQMINERHADTRGLLDQVIAILSTLPRMDVLMDMWKGLRKLVQGRSYRGMYEVLECESTLELKDRERTKQLSRNGRRYAIPETTSSRTRTRPGATGRSH
jgi:hypothetical protein